MFWFINIVSISWQKKKQKKSKKKSPQLINFQMFLSPQSQGMWPVALTAATWGQTLINARWRVYMNAVLSAYVPPRVFHNSVTILCLFSVTLYTVYVTTYYRRLFIALQKKQKNIRDRYC